MYQHSNTIEKHEKETISVSCANQAQHDRKNKRLGWEGVGTFMDKMVDTKVTSQINGLKRLLGAYENVDIAGGHHAFRQKILDLENGLSLEGKLHQIAAEKSAVTIQNLEYTVQALENRVREVTDHDPPAILHCLEKSLDSLRWCSAEKTGELLKMKGMYEQDIAHINYLQRIIEEEERGFLALEYTTRECLESSAWLTTSVAQFRKQNADLHSERNYQITRTKFLSDSYIKNMETMKKRHADDIARTLAGEKENLILETEKVLQKAEREFQIKLLEQWGKDEIHLENEELRKYVKQQKETIKTLKAKAKDFKAHHDHILTETMKDVEDFEQEKQLIEKSLRKDLAASFERTKTERWRLETQRSANLTLQKENESLRCVLFNGSDQWASTRTGGVDLPSVDTVD